LKIFIDTANIEEIKEINEMGFLAGVVKIISKRDRGCKFIASSKENTYPCRIFKVTSPFVFVWVFGLVT
jgi:hypothetical protein